MLSNFAIFTEAIGPEASYLRVILGYDTAINMGVIDMRFSNSVDQIVDMSNKIEAYLKQRLRFFHLHMAVSLVIFL